ncbi:MAG: MBL fold metallo-hydrolase [Candidatus Aenigmarchaeota archaeon]|nr:MBL fold metallo-hydrolase [Candidatus Aenigmarchaeota archaeon]
MTVRLTLLGTGVFVDDEGRRNTSYMIDNGKTTAQVDCGANVPDSFCKLYGREKFLTRPDAILLTHTHWDHAGGVSGEELAIINELRPAAKRRKLIVAGEQTAIENLGSRVQADYDFLPQYGEGYLDVERIPLKPTDEEAFRRLALKLGFKNIEAAETDHSAPNLAYFFDCGNYSFGIGGDGRLRDGTKKLYGGRVKFLAYEAFHFGESTRTHQGIEELVDFCISAGIPHVALVHMDNPARKTTSEIAYHSQRARERGVNVYVPNDHDSFEISPGGVVYMARNP